MIEHLKHLNEGSIQNWNDILKYNSKIPIIEQIKRGSKKACVFMPFMGEFGFFINTFSRYVNYFKCLKKIVCCKKGQEVFFPSADEFFYDWEDFHDDKNKLGANIPTGDSKYKKIKAKISSKFRGFDVIEVGHEIPYRFVQFMPVDLIPFCEELKYDVVIGPRNRARDIQRNYPEEKWQKIVDKLIKNGFSVASIGQKETSYDLKGVSYNSWDNNRPTDAMISMLQNCKLFIGTDTGTSHVATMCGCPMIIFRKQDWSTNFIPFMKQINSNFLFIEDGWENEDSIINKSLGFLNNNKTKVNSDQKQKKVCLHIPLHIKTQEHRKMLIEKKRIFKDFNTLDIDVIFTVDKDDFNSDFSDIPIIDLRKEKSTGIVNPTNKAINYFYKRHGDNCFMIRTGQDVQVDIKGMFDHIQWLQKKSFKDEFLAGVFDEWHNDIKNEAKKVNLEVSESKIRFIQGNFMSAPIKVWKNYYLKLPDTINHYKDDSMTSYLLKSSGGKLEEINCFWKHNPSSYFNKHLLKGENVKSLYQKEKNKNSDVKNLLPIYEKYANKSDNITEFRKGQYITTLCFANSNFKEFKTYNSEKISLIEEMKILLKERDFNFEVKDSLGVDIKETDLLHLDTKHNYSHVLKELEKHHQKVKKYILIHDYETFGEIGDDGKKPALKQAVKDFVDKNNKWRIKEEFKQSNGLVVLEKNACLDALFIYRLFLPKLDKEKVKFLESFEKRVDAFKNNVSRNVRSIIIIDNSSKEMIEFISKRFSNNFDIISINSKDQKEKLSSGKTCSPQRYTFYISSMQVAKEYGGDDSIVFFCEDDYLYRKDAFQKAYRFLKNHSNDFVTLYDHPDRYKENALKNELKLDNFDLELLWECNHHWRTSISTCHSFVATMKSLLLNSEFVLNANLERRDHDMWKLIWKKGASKLYGSVPGLASHRRGPHLNDWEWEEVIKEN